MSEMYLLLEVGESRRELCITEGQNVAAVIEDELHKTLQKAATVRGGSSSQHQGDLYILQRWFKKWGTFVDVSPSELISADRVSAVLQSQVENKVCICNICVDGKAGSWCSLLSAGASARVRSLVEPYCKSANILNYVQVQF